MRSEYEVDLYIKLCYGPYIMDVDRDRLDFTKLMIFMNL